LLTTSSYSSRLMPVEISADMALDSTRVAPSMLTTTTTSPAQVFFDGVLLGRYVESDWAGLFKPFEALHSEEREVLYAYLKKVGSSAEGRDGRCGWWNMQPDGLEGLRGCWSTEGAWAWPGTT